MRHVCKRVRQSGITRPGGVALSVAKPVLSYAEGGRGGVSPARFFRDRRAVGSALAAVIFTLMSLAGVALVGDHKHMTTNRDLLKAAANAATIAVIAELSGRSPGDLTDGERKALDATARRYILANIKANVPQDTYQQAADSLDVNVKLLGPDLVDVDVSAAMGNIVFGRWLWSGVADKTKIVSRTERVGGITEVVLAIDVTRSMLDILGGGNSSLNSRIEVVKRAALSLIDILTADDNGQTAVGLVPWHYLVRLNAGTRARWENQKWASYPTRRDYPLPYDGAPNSGTQTLPDRNGAGWWGCVDHRSDRSLALPADEPFTMAFYPARDHRSRRSNPSISLRDQWSISYQCRADKEQDICYDESLVPVTDRPDKTNRERGQYDLKHSQYGCWENGGEILPLMTDTGQIKGAVRALQANGLSTYSALGIVWAHRLLAHEWQSAWGDTRTHPVDPTEHPDAQKALVLLTDGDDNHVSEAAAHRRQACQAAKDDGITVFTIAAMDTKGNRYSEFKEALKACASKPEYAFVNNATPDALAKAFQDIATHIMRIRRVL